MDSQKELLVSVWMITYNHELYIAQAIESVLEQKTNFKIELIIGEDNSTDKTISIIQAYKSRYPEIITVEFNKPGLGMMGNMLSTLNRCQGKYIALLEGDDYWTDENKLQKQIDFLENNHEYSFCFHNASVVYENGKSTHSFANLKWQTYTAQQIIKDWIIPTPSVVMRNIDLRWPSFTLDCAHGDILLFLLLIEKGKALAFNMNWCVYRKNANSMTNNNQFNENFIKKILLQNKRMNSYFQNKYKRELDVQKFYWSKALLSTYRRKKKYLHFVFYGVPFFFQNLKKLTQ